MPAKFDRRLISQGLTNIVKNATEAIAAVPPEQLGRGRIHVAVKREDRDIVIDASLAIFIAVHPLPERSCQNHLR